MESSLLEEALVEDDKLSGRVVVVEDCVETSATFVLHHFLKRSLQSDNAVVFIAFAHPFSHYDRILRKMGCNLSVQRKNQRFIFLDMLMLECPGEKSGSKMHSEEFNYGLAYNVACILSLTEVVANDRNGGEAREDGLLALYGEIDKAVELYSSLEGSRKITIMIDDISLMEVVANGSSSHVLDFLHYCYTLKAKYGCSFVTLNHEDIYSSENTLPLILQLEYLADVIIKAEPLATGLASDVHGQLTVLNKGSICDLGTSSSKVRNFHFRVKENTVDYFYPGTWT